MVSVITVARACQPRLRQGPVSRRFSASPTTSCRYDFIFIYTQVTCLKTYIICLTRKTVENIHKNNTDNGFVSISIQRTVGLKRILNIRRLLRYIITAYFLLYNCKEKYYDNDFRSDIDMTDNKISRICY